MLGGRMPEGRMPEDQMKVGVLALQGAFREHREVFDALGAEAIEVRASEDLAGCDSLVLPGGESTVIGKLLVSSGLLAPVRDRIRDGVPTLATCAGLILLAREVLDRRDGDVGLALLDLQVRRNAYGSQRQSFEVPLAVAALGTSPFPGVFIRAPAILAAGDGVDVLAHHDDQPVLVRSASVWAATFHPELSGDLRLHQRFLQEVP